MVYIKVGEGNGGFILNISESGLAVQAAMALIDDKFPSMRFHFAKSKTWIEASGVIAWKNASNKVAGIKFVDLSKESRIQIREWISSQRAGTHTPGDAETLGSLEVSPSAPDDDTEGSLVPEAATIPVERESFVPGAGSTIAVPSQPSASVGLRERHDSTAKNDSTPQNGGRPMQVVPIPEPVEFEQADTSIAPPEAVSRKLLKRYLVDERFRIRLYDLVSEKAEKLSNELNETNFPSNVPVTDKEFVARLHRYEELCEELVSIFITGCFWGEQNQELIWVKLLERVANAPGARNGRPQWIALRSYPALLLLYAGAVAAIANEKYSTLEALLVKPRLIGPDCDYRLVDRLSPAAVIEDERLIKTISGGTDDAAFSAYLCSYLREPFREFVPSDDVYDEIFDHFEYLFSLVWIDENPVGASLGWVPLGRFAWRHLTGLQSGASVMGKVGAEAAQQGKDWPVFRAGLFGGSMRRFLSARNRVATFMASQR